MTAPIAGYVPVFRRTPRNSGRMIRLPQVSPIAISIWGIGPTTILIFKNLSISTLIILSKWYEKKRCNGEEQKNKQYIQKKIFTNKYNWNTYLLDLCWTYESIAFEITAKRICLGNWCSIIQSLFKSYPLQQFFVTKDF